MKYSIIAIGKLKHSFYREACVYFQKRLANYTKLEVSEVKEVKALDTKQIKYLESLALLKAAKGYIVALDEQGKEFNSKELARHITKLENQGISQISLLIGGAEGHSEVLKSQVSALWSLSKFTLAHELARLLLLEQLYRIETIRVGHPYHRN